MWSANGTFERVGNFLSSLPLWDSLITRRPTGGGLAVRHSWQYECKLIEGAITSHDTENERTCWLYTNFRMGIYPGKVAERHLCKSYHPTILLIQRTSAIQILLEVFRNSYCLALKMMGPSSSTVSAAQ